MRDSVAPHLPFDDDEIRAAAEMMRKALAAKNLPADEIDRRIAEVFPA